VDAIEDVGVPDSSWSTAHDVALAPFAALYELCGVLVGEVKLALFSVLWGAGVIIITIVYARVWGLRSLHWGWFCI